MKLQFWSIGKQHEPYVDEGIALFTKRIMAYYPVHWQLIAPLKNAGKLPPDQLKLKEAEVVLELLKKDDYLILLDEKGKMLSSETLAAFFQQRANESNRSLVFLIGGAYGVAEAVQQRADFVWRLSDLVFPHQLVRLILAEQIYRACSILRNEKYHHS
jgi:23S rRNA (pseudouridine1915-N3)-methyltransferase